MKTIIAAILSAIALLNTKVTKVPSAVEVRLHEMVRNHQMDSERADEIINEMREPR